MPSNSRHRNDIIYKVAEQLFALYYSLLTFFSFDYLISLKFTNCFHTSLIGSLRKRIKPDTPLIFNWELFYESTNDFHKINLPLSGRQRNSIVYKVDEQLFALYYSLLTFLRFEQHFFAEFTNCFHIPSIFVAYFFLKK